jgi:lambda repressor-like predicted transcriptional regulator
LSIVSKRFISPDDAILEAMYGKEGVLERRRNAELEHERQLAAIREQSQGLPTGAKAAPIDPKAKGEAISRRAFVMPLLEAKGWSILDWANDANVSHATAQDYLDNKTKPYPSTRKKLAKALGVNALPN